MTLCLPRTGFCLACRLWFSGQRHWAGSHLQRRKVSQNRHQAKLPQNLQEPQSLSLPLAASHGSCLL